MLFRRNNKNFISIYSIRYYKIMNKFNIKDEVILLTNMPFELKKGDKCIITNISVSDNIMYDFNVKYHIRKNIDSRYEFTVEENQITKNATQH